MTLCAIRDDGRVELYDDGDEWVFLFVGTEHTNRLPRDFCEYLDLSVTAKYGFTVAPGYKKTADRRALEGIENLRDS